MRTQKARLNFTPSDALTADAGDYAPAIARVWPRPHAPYMAADTGRRRLIALIASRAGVDRAHQLAEPLEAWSARRLTAEHWPDAPAGLIEALKRCVGQAWTRTVYKWLVDLLREPEAAKTLRHAQAISAGLVETLAALPPALRRLRVVALLPTPHHARLATRAILHGLGKSPDRVVIARLAQRMERAGSTDALFRMLIEEIGLGRLAPPPIPGTEWLAPIDDVKDMRRAALRFENCLEYRIPGVLSGEAAYYEVLGDEPAIVEIVRGRDGLWAIGEVRGPQNRCISDQLMRRIVSHCAFHGASRRTQDRPIAVELAEVAGWA